MTTIITITTIAGRMTGIRNGRRKGGTPIARATKDVNKELISLLAYCFRHFLDLSYALKWDRKSTETTNSQLDQTEMIFAGVMHLIT
jgi:hypothetical protein